MSCDALIMSTMRKDNVSEVEVVDDLAAKLKIAPPAETFEPCLSTGQTCALAGKLFLDGIDIVLES